MDVHGWALSVSAANACVIPLAELERAVQLSWDDRGARFETTAAFGEHWIRTTRDHEGTRRTGGPIGTAVQPEAADSNVEAEAAAAEFLAQLLLSPWSEASAAERIDWHLEHARDKIRDPPTALSH